MTYINNTTTTYIDYATYISSITTTSQGVKETIKKKHCFAAMEYRCFAAMEKLSYSERRRGQGVKEGKTPKTIASQQWSAIASQQWSD